MHYRSNRTHGAVLKIASMQGAASPVPHAERPNLGESRIKSFLCNGCPASRAVNFILCARHQSPRLKAARASFERRCPSKAASAAKVCFTRCMQLPSHNAHLESRPRCAHLISFASQRSATMMRKPDAHTGLFAAERAIVIATRANRMTNRMIPTPVAMQLSQRRRRLLPSQQTRWPPPHASSTQAPNSKKKRQQACTQGP